MSKHAAMSDLLATCCQNGNLDGIEYAISQGFPVNQPIKGTSTALACCLRNGFADGVKLLLSAGGNVMNKSVVSALRAAVTKKHVQAVEYILHKVDLREDPYKYARYDYSYLEPVMIADNAEMARLLYKYYKELPPQENTQDKEFCILNAAATDLNWLLYRSIALNAAECVSIFLDLGADPLSRPHDLSGEGHNKMQPLYFAFYRKAVVTDNVMFYTPETRIGNPCVGIREKCSHMIEKMLDKLPEDTKLAAIKDMMLSASRAKGNFLNPTLKFYLFNEWSSLGYNINVADSYGRDTEYLADEAYKNHANDAQGWNNANCDSTGQGKEFHQKLKMLFQQNKTSVCANRGQTMDEDEKATQAWCLDMAMRQD